MSYLDIFIVMEQDIILQAYKNLIAIPDSQENNILNRLSDWLCDFLSNDENNVLYYSLPIWNYVSNGWVQDFPMGVSKSNDPSFYGQSGWCKVKAEDDKEIRKEKLNGTRFKKFFSESELSADGFSFVEFVTQNATSIDPIFSIEFTEDNNDTSCRFEFDKSHLRLINNTQNSNLNFTNIEAFISTVCKLLMVNNGSLLDEKQKKDLISLYDFLCLYQKHFGADLRYIYLVTSRLFKDTIKDLSSGGLVLVCKEKIDANKLFFISAIINLCYREKGGKNWEEKCRKEAVKSAISAIMSRNMSHNLGSHYMYYTKAYLEDLAQRSEEKGPDIRGAAKVLGYMQARMDYLATIISNDKYPNGAVNFKSQIYDELTVDDFSKRHFSDSKERNKRTTNFLLSNLIMSENFTRTSILKEDVFIDEDEAQGKFKSIRLQVKYQRDGSKSYETFTGNCRKFDFEVEKDIKNEISKLNIALPGGTMSCHAFFNIVENFIRNSAKYLQEDFKPEGLLFTIAIKRSRTIKNAYDFVIYDNKNNAKKVLAIVNQQLEELSILDNKGSIEKSSKGLKEMLFSSVWMRSSQYPDESFADIINRIQLENAPTQKLSLINKYGFQFVSVADDGTVHEKRTMRKDNLGIRFTLPEFSFSRNFVVKRSDTYKDIITKALSISSDIVCLGNKRKKSSVAPPYYGYFTRSYFKTDILQSEFEKYLENSNVLSLDQTIAKDVYRYKRILDRRFSEETGGDIDKICLWVGSIRDRKKIPRDKSRIIYYERHLSTKEDGFAPYIDYAYADSISGGNFTITLNSLIEDGISMEDDSSKFKYKSWYDKLYGLKIKESALTRITLIDERLFNNMKSDGVLKEQEYSFKNIRVLNINLESAHANKWSIQDILEGNAFRDNNNRTHFLSIHLGLIEKVVKSIWGDKYGRESAIEEKVLLFMKDLRDYFSGMSQDVFVSVHSGRGNFSKELEGPLASYPFISLAAIENAFSNSKYLLAQLFYNTVYIGKGVIND